LKNIKLLEILGMLDDEMVQKAIETNDAQKLKELKLLEKRKKNSTLIKYMSVFASSLAVLIVEVIMINNNRIDKIDKSVIGENNGVQISNPISEVKSIQELESHIGKTLEKYQIKEIESMTKFNDEKMIQIYYEDNTSLRISEDQNIDNSGITGADVEGNEIINNIEVKIRKLEDNVSKCIFATWNDGKYSYTYYSNETENIIEVLKKIV